MMISETILRQYIRELFLEAALGGGGTGLLKYRKRIEAFRDHVQGGKAFTLVSQDGRTASDQTFIVTGPATQMIINDINELLSAWDRNGLGQNAPKGILKDYPEINAVAEKLKKDLLAVSTPLGPMSLAKIFKTKDLGGRGNPEKCEAAQIAKINKLIDHVAMKTPGAGVNIQVGPAGSKSNIAYNVVRCVKQAGTPKADCKLIDGDGREVAWMSLKCADDGSQMNQWSGIDSFKDHPEVKAFTNQLTMLALGHARLDAKYFRTINDINLQYMGTFGKNAGPSGFGPNNVNMILATNSLILLSDTFHNARGGGPVYKFDVPTGLIMYNTGEVPPASWTPVLGARYTKGRGTGVGLQDIRVGIWPAAQAKWEGEIMPTDLDAEDPPDLYFTDTDDPQELPHQIPTIRKDYDEKGQPTLTKTPSAEPPQTSTYRPGGRRDPEAFRAIVGPSLSTRAAATAGGRRTLPENLLRQFIREALLK